MTELSTDKAYKVEGSPGIAWRFEGYAIEYREVETIEQPWEDVTEYIYETEEVEDRTRARMHMVGDDRTFVHDVSELTELNDDDYCGSCGQIGCGWH